MKKVILPLFLLFILNVSAQDHPVIKGWPKKIWLYTNHGDLIKGILIGTSDSSVKIFPGKFSEYNSTSKISIVSVSYFNINNIKIHKKSGLINGMLLGAGVGILPVLVGSVFGPSIGQGGAYVSIVAVPLGIIAGAIIGSTSKRKFFIGGDKSKFLSFHKRMKY